MRKYLNNLKQVDKLGVVIILRVLFMTLFSSYQSKGILVEFIGAFIFLVVLSLIVDGTIIFFYYLLKRRDYPNMKTLIIQSYTDRIWIAFVLFIIFILFFLNRLHLNSKYGL